MESLEQSSSTAVAAPAKPGALTKPGDGFGDIKTRDLVIPSLRIGQGTTRTDGITPGKLYGSLDTSMQKERIRAVALTMQHGQAYFPRDEKGKPIFDAPLVCGSDNGVVPSLRIDKPIFATCRDARGEAVCPAAKWAGKGEPPACQEVHRYVIVDLDDGIPYRFSLRRTDITTSKKFLTNLLFRARPQKLSMYDFEFVLSTVRHQDGDGVWYTAVFSDLQIVKTAGTHRALFEQFGGAVSSVDEEDGGEATGGAAAAKAPDEGKPATPAAGPQTAPPPAPPKGKSAKGRELDFNS